MKNAELEARLASLQMELATSEVACVAKSETYTTLTQMKSMAMYVILHARAELMKEFKAGQHVDWDSNFEISVWKEIEAKLARIEEPSSPRVESQRLIESEKEGKATTA